MTVAELLGRISSAELAEWRAFDQLDQVDTVTSDRLAPRHAMNYDRLVTKLDRWWEPV
jgi:hypothetical protein